jgi:hypothetical protein
MSVERSQLHQATVVHMYRVNVKRANRAKIVLSTKMKLDSAFVCLW